MPQKPFRMLILTAAFCCSSLAFSQIPAPQTTSVPGAESKVYKTIDDVELLLHVFQPKARTEGELRPAIIFFFGGGWNSGTVNQFVPHCNYLSERGMIAIVADYRVRSRHGVTPFECVSDAKSAIRWIRSHAAEFGIDSERIAAGGGSAGGHLAASTALVTGYDESNEDTVISSKPNALVLFNPALDMVSVMQRRSEASDQNELIERAAEISPNHLIREHTPPTIIFHGTADTTVPIQQAEYFCSEMAKYGNLCKLIPFEGRPHGFFNARAGNDADHLETLRLADEFLVSIGYLK